eukprot:3026988-Rhodomonas_salina.2
MENIRSFMPSGRGERTAVANALQGVLESYEKEGGRDGVKYNEVWISVVNAVHKYAIKGKELGSSKMLTAKFDRN